MILFHKNTRGMASKSVHFFIILCFLANLILPGTGFAQVLNMPQPGTMLSLSPSYAPALLTGIKINPENPLEFHFIVNDGDDDLKGDALRGEAEKMIRYFLASLTIPQQDLWVNLSPYEKDRIAPEALASTDIGRDLLAQDYLLKQITASLIYPEGETGKKFWERIYKKAYEAYGTTEIPVDTFNKVWIMPDKAVVYEHDNMVFVAESSLKVMLEKDYLAGQKNNEKSIASEDVIASDIVREIVIPELQKEVNTGKNFAALRQVYNSLILATWFKKSLRQSLLGHIYVDKSKVKGIDLGNTQAKEEIYQQYLAAYQKGAYNYIKTEYDQYTQKNIPRKYFSGGFIASSMVPVSVATPTLAQQRTMAPDNDNTNFVVALETPKRMSSALLGVRTGETIIALETEIFNYLTNAYPGEKLNDLIFYLEKGTFIDRSPTLAEIWKNQIARKQKILSINVTFSKNDDQKFIKIIPQFSGNYSSWKVAEVKGLEERPEIPSFYKADVVKKISLIDQSERAAAIQEAKYNLFNLPSDKVFIDYLTDSGTGAMSDKQAAAMMLHDESYAGSVSYKRMEESIKDVLGFPYILPTHQGRAAENVINKVLITSEKNIVLGNPFFDTTAGHIDANHGKMVELPVAENEDLDSEFPFKGNIDLAKLRTALIENKGKVAYILMTVTDNLSGGQPVSMENLKGVRALATEFGAPFFGDIARFAENAYFIKEREAGYQNKSIREIVKEMMSVFDGVQMSAKKDGLTPMGGFIAMRSEDYKKKFEPFVIYHEGFLNYGGISGKDMEIIAQGFQEVVDESYLKDRIAQARYLGTLLHEAGVPVRWPVGGHGVFIDGYKFFNGRIPKNEFPAQALGVALYEEGGIRGVEIGSLLKGRTADGKQILSRHEFLRLAIPRRVYSKEHLKYTADVIINFYNSQRKNDVTGLMVTKGRNDPLMHFTAELTPVKGPASSSLTNEEFIDQVKRLANAGAGQYGTIKQIDIFKGPILLASFNKISFSNPEVFQNRFTNGTPDQAERIVVSYVQPLIAQLILVRDEKNNWMPKGALPSAIDARLLSSLSRMRVQDIADKDLKGKTVLVLDDLNVPMDGVNITDFSRIDAAMETIKYLQSKGAKVIIMSHLGRPKGKVKEEFSLAPIYTYIKETALKGSNVHFDPSFQTMRDAKSFVSSMKEGEVLLLQNTRFNAGEEAISNAEDALAKAKKGKVVEEIEAAEQALEPARQKHAALAEAYFDGVDVYVNDAFSVDHRGYVSVIGAPKSIPRVAGLLVQEETEALKKFLEGVEAVAMGGSKVSDKIKIIRNLLKSQKLKYLLVGGAMRNAFLKAMGVDVKDSFGASEKEVAVASELLALNDSRIKTPLDVVATPRLSEDAQAQAKAGTIFETKIFDVADLKNGKASIPDGWELVDIGPKTVQLYRKLILESKLTFMNGAMGIFEIDQFEDGTKGVLEAMADAKDVGGYTGVGGGDTVTAVNKFKILYERFGHVFLAGGATLEVLEEKVLPGLGALSFASSNIILVKMPSSATWRELVQMFRAQAPGVKINNVEGSRENLIITGKVTKETRNSYSGVIRTEVIAETKKEGILREDDFLAMEIFEGHLGQEMPKKIRISFTKESSKGNIVFVRQNGIWDIDHIEGINAKFSSSPLDGLDPEAEGVHGIVHLTRVYDDPSRPLIKLTIPTSVPLFNVNDDIKDLKGLENFIVGVVQAANQNAPEGVKSLEDMETYASTDADGSGFRFLDVFTPRNRAWLEGLDKITHARFNFSGSRALIFFRDTEKKQWVYKEAEEIDVRVGSSGIKISDLTAGFKPDDVIKLINEAVGQEVDNNGIKVMLGHMPGSDYLYNQYVNFSEDLKQYISEIVINYKNGWRISISRPWAGAGWKVHTFVDAEGKNIEFVQGTSSSAAAINIPFLAGPDSTIDSVISSLDKAVGQKSITDETKIRLGFWINNTDLRNYRDMPSKREDLGKEIQLSYPNGWKLCVKREDLMEPWKVSTFIDAAGKPIQFKQADNVGTSAVSSALKVGDIISEDGAEALQEVANDRGRVPTEVTVYFSDDEQFTYKVAQEGSLAAIWNNLDGSDDIVSLKIVFTGSSDFCQIESLNTLNSAWKVKDIKRPAQDDKGAVILNGPFVPTQIFAPKAFDARRKILKAFKYGLKYTIVRYSDGKSDNDAYHQWAGERIQEVFGESGNRVEEMVFRVEGDNDIKAVRNKTDPNVWDIEWNGTFSLGTEVVETETPLEAAKEILSKYGKSDYVVVEYANGAKGGSISLNLFEKKDHLTNILGKKKAEEIKSMIFEYQLSRDSWTRRIIVTPRPMAPGFWDVDIVWIQSEYQFIDGMIVEAVKASELFDNFNWAFDSYEEARLIRYSGKVSRWNKHDNYGGVFDEDLSSRDNKIKRFELFYDFDKNARVIAERINGSNNWKIEIKWGSKYVPPDSDTREIEKKSSSSAVPTGGIDFAGIYEDLKIKTDANGVPLQMEFQNLNQIQIEGFVPVIINIMPINNLPALLGFNLDIQNQQKLVKAQELLAIREE